SSSNARVPVTPGMMGKLRLPDDANLSPDGQHVAFVAADWIPEQPKKRRRIWLVGTSGKEPRPITRSHHEDSCPRWSPDGKQLAFISKEVSEGNKEKQQQKAQPYVISFPGGEPTQICTMPNGVSDLEWSSDGSYISFLSFDGKEPDSDPRVIRQGQDNRLWKVHVDSDIPEPITPEGFTIWEYAWSPDSRQIAVYYTSGPDETDWYRGQIGIVSADGGAIRQLTHLTRQASALTWSPDGTRLAYISGEWSDPCKGGGDIFVIGTGDGNNEARNLTSGIGSSPAWCRWFPDGHRLLFTAWQGVTQQIGILDEADGTITPLAEDFVMNAAWPHLSTTPDLQRFTTTHMNEQHPPDIWFGELASEDETAKSIHWKRLSRLNPIAEETFALVPSQVIRYESVDGWEIEALFTPPLAGKGDTPPALVVDVHGGPSWAWSDDFGYGYFSAQELASAGYAVLRANIRGSWGRGVAFADAVVGDMGGKDFQDLLYGIDYLVKRGMVDGDRVAIGGGSYGGFMAAWAVTQTTRFKAAIMAAGLSDFHSFHAQSNIPDWDTRFIGVDPLEHPDVYRTRSAITYAAHVKTPTLILHGEEDHIVPVNQAYAFYRALRERGVPVELVIYPREGHGNLEYEHRRDEEERVLSWLEQYL
ncbi:MAG TPA: S9 family peptidase, partial [Ktedonobacteraceae bacterium]|nr:S9 family peptidase [Ktedonobacteraceae bacterium]